jgi:predicted nucleotidyltransferase
MIREALMQSLQSKTPAAFVETHLFDCIPAVFGSDRAIFVAWKRDLAAKIEVDPACITIVGSAATGASLNPSKNFKLFDDASDIDVAIVSPHHFAIAWRYLRMNGARRLRVDYRTRIAWDEHVNRYIYWGTIATDRLLGVLPFGLQWLKATSEMGQVLPTQGRSVNLRIYADFDSLRAYHEQGIRSLRNSQNG